MTPNPLRSGRESIDHLYTQEAVNLAQTADVPAGFIGEALLETVKAKPRLIHHYTTAGAALSILQTRTLRLTHIRFSNDFREFESGLDALAGATNAIAAETPVADLKHLLGAFAKRLADVRDRAAIFIGCFSAGGDKLSQWRGYAGNGFALGFDTMALQAAAFGRGHMLLPCVYDKQQHDSLSRMCVQYGIDIYHSLSGKGPPAVVQAAAAIGFEAAMMTLAPLMKDAAFAEEDEWRIVTPPYHVQHEALHFTQRGRHIAPYYELPLVDEGKHTLRRVRIAPPPVDDTAKTGLLWALTDFGFDGVEVVDSRITYRQY